MYRTLIFLSHLWCILGNDQSLVELSSSAKNAQWSKQKDHYLMNGEHRLFGGYMLFLSVSLLHMHTRTYTQTHTDTHAHTHAYRETHLEHGRKLPSVAGWCFCLEDVTLLSAMVMLNTKLYALVFSFVLCSILQVSQ